MQENKSEKEIIQELERRIAFLEQERKLNRKASVWGDIKNELDNDFNTFKWTDKWSYQNCNDELIQREEEYNEANTVSSAIGTLVRCTLKKKRIALLEEDDKAKATRIAQGIIKIMKDEFEGGE